ncbi:MAG TPA: polymer-forming cytoskeletal protein [Polyangiaceae bacterium]|jgi:cytoskeletal protein CcmA (bactofilin family)
MSEAKKAGGPRTLVEEGTSLKGSLSSKCPIDVKGRVEGDLTAPSLTVSVSGAVHGKVKVEELLSEGEISGEVDADVVRLSGVVRDNTVLRTKSLEVKLGATNGKMQVTFGECVLEVGEAPTKEVEASPTTSATAPNAKEAKDAQNVKGAPAAEGSRSVPPPPKASVPPPAHA